MTTFQAGFSTALAGSRFRKWFLPAVSFLPLAAAIAISVFLFSRGTAGFQIEKTQHYLLVSRTAATVNPVQEADRITHIGGMAYPDVLGALVTRKAVAGPPNRVTIVRKDQVIYLDVQYTPLRALQFLSAIGPYLVFMLLSLVMCLSVLRWTPSGQPAGLFVLILSSFALLFVSQFPLQFGILDPGVLSATTLTTTAANWIGFSAWLHFALRFPPERQVWTNKPWRIAALVYLAPPGVAVGLSLALAGLHPEFFGWLQRLRRWAVPLMLLVIGIKLWKDYRATGDVQTKNQIRLIIAGLILGIAVYLFLYLFPNIIIDRPLVPFYMVALSSTLIPLALFLAVVRYRLLDVDQMISWTLSHFVLVGALIAIYTAVLLALKRMLGEQGPFSEGFFIAFILIIALFFAPVRNRLEHAIDVHFFRQKIDYRKVLHEFSAKIVAAIRMADLIHMIVDRLPREFNLEKAAVLIAAGGPRRIYPETDAGLKELLCLEAVSERLEKHRPFFLCAQGYSDPALAREAALLVACGYQLVLGLRSRTAFTGMLLLGGKRNKTFYSGRDIQVLATLANQAATAVENALNYESLERSQTELKKMFAKVLHAEKLSAMGEMAAVLAHEIKNPLGVIRSSAQYIAAAGTQEASREELLGFILDEVDRLTTVVNHMLDMARYVPPEFASVRLDRLLEAIVQRWAESADHNPKVAIHCRCDRSETILADQQQLVQVALNLIRNSEEAMPEGGRLDIAMTPDDQEDHAVIRFKDTGAGVPPEQIDHLWEKFYTTKKNGVGLGLSVCKQIVQAHGGTIGIESGPAHGLTVTIRLPRRPGKEWPLSSAGLMPSTSPA
ncbi:MAG: hypothetical protein C4519_21835 [Desulfobacteraceae bacterium]|nr:MAG: hypothetical protein C4519_21835 [Desulfobacteraceae bacterium]